jgi:hypothetical protein
MPLAYMASPETPKAFQPPQGGRESKPHPCNFVPSPLAGEG